MENFLKQNFTMQRRIHKLLSVLLLLALWYLAAALIKDPLILPFPHSVLLRLCALMKTAFFWKSFFFTFLRVISAFLISLILGFFLGLISADFPIFKDYIDFPLALIRATPVVAVILPALFWFKSGTVPVFVAVLMALPVITTAAQKGFEHNLEAGELLFKASSRGFRGWLAFRYIRLPAAAPSLKAGAESAFGLCWKVVAAGEVLSIPRYATGAIMQRSQVHLETADTLAVTAVLVFVSWLCQRAFYKK